jgi:hypothetical protein
LLPLVPLLAAASGLYLRPLSWRLSVLALAAVFVLKMAAPNQPWGLPYGRGAQLAAARPLDAYAALRRGNELIVLAPDDQFYATVLGLPRVRYVFQSPDLRFPKPALDFRELGIILTADEFRDFDRIRPEFTGRLQEWGLKSGAPLGTVILARSPLEMAALAAASPSADFFAPESLVLDSRLHSRWQPGPGYYFLLAR